jgi:hypothetical protein
LLGPCSFEATRITRHSFSIVYLNPPFDDEFGGGGREEVKFLRQAADVLVPGGILVLVCPVNHVYGRHEMCELIDTWFLRLSNRGPLALARNATRGSLLREVKLRRQPDRAGSSAGETASEIE